MVNILFTSAGRRVSLIKDFRQSILKRGITGSIVVADGKSNAPAIFVADFFELVPRVSDPGYIQSLIDICIKHDIKILVPLIDTELYTLSVNKHQFEEIGVVVIVSSPEVNRICGDKRETSRFFKEIGVETPEIYNFEEILKKPVPYPLMLKPADGSCSAGITKVDSLEDLKFFEKYISNVIIQEFILGEEYTIDVLVDFDGCVKSVIPRLRIETRAGEISKGRTVKNPALIEAAKRVAEVLPGALGCITIQCFLGADGKVTFIEINPRFGGGYPLSYRAGADFPGWIIDLVRGEEIPSKIDMWEENLTMLRYDDAIFTSDLN
jgi:carbamoyl-phosphate synthase large subunit